MAYGRWEVGIELIESGDGDGGCTVVVSARQLSITVSVCQDVAIMRPLNSDPAT